MTWLNPAAAFALVLVAAPLLIHLLVHHRAAPFPFPTLRFIRPTRLAAIRRQVLEDIALLAIRLAIVAAAVAAFAAPLVMSGARRAQWNARLTRAVVIDGEPGGGRRSAGLSGAPSAQAAAEAKTIVREQQFTATHVADGIHRAIAWLRDSPPARRELVIAGPLTAGSVRDADIAAIPADVGIRFERLGTVPAERTIEAPPLLAPSGTARRMVTLSAAGTSVRIDVDGAQARWPIDIFAPAASRAAVDAAAQAVQSQSAPQPAPDHAVKVLLVDRRGSDSAVIRGEAIGAAWMADAAAAIARDRDLRDEAAIVPSGFSDRRYGSAPWIPLAFAADGQALISAAASGNALVIATAAEADDLLTPVLLRSIAASTAPRSDPVSLEVVPIAESTLRAWTRDPGPVRDPRVDTIERDDRRWLWVLVLTLLGVETWVRRTRRVDASAIESEEPRVA